MKGLLQSKRFKSNLRKWLFMYVGVMALLTSVITYSKYITSMMADPDSATVPKFNVFTEQLECPSADKECLNEYRPTGQRIPFYFTVNSEEIETEADLILTFAILNKFELIEISEIETEVQGDGTPITKQTKIYDGETKSCENGYVCLSDNTGFDTGIEESDLTLSIKRDTIYTSKGESTYKVVVKYNCKETTEEACDLDKVFGTNKELDLEVVKIGYSAIQRDR